MGIERGILLQHHLTQNQSCKKSPQAWGLKEVCLSAIPVLGVCLQKESPSMGIERTISISHLNGCCPTCKKSPQAWGLKAQPWPASPRSAAFPCKKSPQAWGLKATPSRCHASLTLNLQKESPSMGIERINVVKQRIEEFLLQKESPSMGIERLCSHVSIGKVGFYLQKESPSMGIESSSDFPSF